MPVTINGSTNTSVWDFKLEVSEGVANIAGNTSPLTVTAYIGRTSSASYMYGAKLTVTVNVTGCSAQTIKYNNANRVDVAAGAWLKLGSTTFSAVPHDSNGSKTVTVSASFTNNVSPASGSASGSVTLATIPRKSTLTASNGTLGTPLTFTINRASDDFTHTVTYKCGSVNSTVTTKTTRASFEWTPAVSLAAENTTGTSVSLTFTMTTYSGDTSLGTVTKTISCAIPASVKPTVSAALEDITGVDDIYGSPVAGLSKIKATATATMAYGSPIKSYSITIDGTSYTGQSVTSGVLRNPGQSRVTVTATDARGRSGSWTYDMTVLEYKRPQVTELAVHRTNGDYIENDQGEYVCVTFSTAVDDMADKNQANYTLRYKKTNEGSWSSIDISDLNHNFNIMHHAILFEASASSSYDVELTAADRHYSTTRATSASTAFSLMDWHNSGTGIRFGGVAEEDHTLQNDLALKQIGNTYCFSSIGAATTDGYIRMATIEITATNADTPISFEFTQRKAETPMKVNVLFAATADLDPGLQSITYEGENYGAYLVKSAVSTWDLYVKKVNQSDTVTLNHWYTSYRQMSRIRLVFPGNIETEVPQGLLGYYRATPAKLQSLLDYIYPVGSIYLSYSHVSPASLFGGTWERLKNAFLWAVDESGTIGQTGGEKTHTLTVNEMPAHSHKAIKWDIKGTSGETYAPNVEGKVPWSYALSTDSVGGGAAHNNMPPYIQVSAWRRTA